MKSKNLLLGMIALLTLSICGCEVENEEKVTTAEVSGTAGEVSEATVEVSDTTVEAGDIFDLQENRRYYEHMYQEILDYNYELITGGMDDDDYVEASPGIGEAVRNDNENAMNTIGYTFVDSNMDGEVELLIGSINEEKDGKCYGQLIYSVYTYKDAPVLILEGWSRNRCSLLNDGTYFVEGSGGAMYSVFENKQLKKNGTEFTYNDYYFTYEKDETYEEIGFYHNYTGEWDKAVSEEISEAEYTDKSIGYSSRMLTLEFKPFSMYEYFEDVSETECKDINMHIEWAADDKVNDEQLPFFEADMNEPQVAAIVSPDADVYNFKVLSLCYEDIDSEGNPVFSADELYQQEVLSCDTEFIIKFTMCGTIPSYGISYEDVLGNTYYYGLTDSGMDGSALLTEIMVK